MALVPDNFRPRTIRGIIIALLNEFNGLVVENFETGDYLETTKVKTIPVSLQFGHMNKYHEIIKRGEPSAQKYMPLPKMALSWDSINFAGDRAAGLSEVRTFYNTALGLNDIDRFISNLNPRPYDLGFSLEIRTESMNHFTQLMENILPYFDPARYLRVKEFSFLNIERDIKVILEGISPDFLVEQNEDNIRYVRGVLQLNVKAFLYRELSDDGLIKEIRTRYYPGTMGQGLSAVGGANTSGWDSSSTFTAPYDISGNTQTLTMSATLLDFDYFIDFI